MMKDKKVKNVILLLIFLVQIFDGFSKTTIIEGIVLNYREDLGPKIIDVCTLIYEINNSECTKIPVKENGLFRVELDLNSAMEILVCYDERCIRLIVEPDQMNYLEIDRNEFNDKRHNPEKVRLRGDYKSYNEIIVDYVPKYKERFFYFYYFENSRRSRKLSTDDYYEYRSRYYKKEIKFLENYIEENEVTDSLFIDWAKQNIVYDYGNDLHHHFYENYDPMIDEIPKWYLKKMEDEIALNHEEKVKVRSYGTYLHYKLMILTKASDNTAESRKLIENKKKVVGAKIEYVIKNSDGISRDKMLGELMNSFLKFDNSELVKKYLDELSDESIRKYIERKIKLKRKEL